MVEIVLESNAPASTTVLGLPDCRPVQGYVEADKAVAGFIGQRCGPHSVSVTEMPAPEMNENRSAAQPVIDNNTETSVGHRGAAGRRIRLCIVPVRMS